MPGSGRQALIIGFGSAARGFVAPALRKTHFDSIFCLSSDRWRWWKEQAHPPDSYHIEKIPLDRTCLVRHSCRPIVAVPCFDKEGSPSLQVLTIGKNAELIITSIGTSNLPQLVPVLTEIVRERAKRAIERPCNIIFAENVSVEAKEIASLRDCVMQSIGDPQLTAYVVRNVGFVDAVLEATIVSKRGSLDLVAYGTTPVLYVNGSQVRGYVPTLRCAECSITLEREIRPIRMRRLFIHNFADTAVAYLGARNGYEYLSEAISDAGVQRILDGALREIGTALALEFPHRPEMREAQLQRYIEEEKKRIGDVRLKDRVARTGRDPLRKLGIDERLLGPARLARKHGIQPVHLIECAKAALDYWLGEEQDSVDLSARERNLLGVNPDDREVGVPLT